MREGDGQSADRAPLPVVSVGLRRVLDLVLAGEATNRAEIARRSGQARSTVGQQVDQLLGRDILQELESNESVRGRPPRQLTLSPRAGTVAVADVDTLETRIALADLGGDLIARDTVPLRIDAGPEVVLETVSDRLFALLERSGRDPRRVRQVVMALPAPVDHRRGRPVRPNGMPGWDNFPVAERLRARFDAPARVDNDANLMALGEARHAQEDTPLLCIKIAAGIGAGLITGSGRIYRGADGAAGDVGHIQSRGGGDVLCSCGNVGCVGALASHRAVLRTLGVPESTEADPLHGVHELAKCVANNDPPAVRALRQAATEIGELAAMLVYVFNPRTLVLGGPLSELRDDLLSGVRAVVYQRALPLATRKLTITTTQLGPDSALHGAVALATRDIFSERGIARLLVD
ncbi:ROK family protein [Streptomyces sp. LZ34]